MKNSMLLRIGIYACISLGILSVISAVTGYYMIWEWVLGIQSFSTFEILLGQIANTFLVLSLTSVLSTNIGSVYWVDIKDVKLVVPFFQCFLALTTYLITTMIFSGVSYALNYDAGVCTSFVCSIVLLIFLTYKMIGVYFGRNEIRQQLRWEYQKAMLEAELSYHTYRKMLKYITKTVEEKELEYSRNQKKYIETKKKWIESIDESQYGQSVSSEKVEEFDEIVAKLKEKTLQALNNSDFTTVQENVELLVTVNDGNSFMDMLDAIVVVNTEYAATLLLKAKDKMDVEYQMQISDVARNILRNMAGNVYSSRTVQKLLWTISSRYLQVKRYKEFLEHIKKEEKRYKEEEARIVERIKACFFEEDKVAVIEEKRRFNEQIRERLLNFFEDNKSIVVGKTYKPIYEMYAAYMKNDLNLIMLYLEVMWKDRAEVELELKDSLAFIVRRISHKTEITLSYIEPREVEIIDRIIEREKVQAFLPELVLNTLIELKEIELR